MAKGISRKSVMPKPRYNPCVRGARAWNRPCEEVAAAAAVPSCHTVPMACHNGSLVEEVCILALTTSVGTRTKHAATSPTEAAIMCVSDCVEKEDGSEP